MRDVTRKGERKSDSGVDVIDMRDTKDIAGNESSVMPEPRA